MKQDFGAVCFLETEDVILIFLKIFQTLKDMLVRLKSGTDVGEIQFLGVFQNDLVHIVHKDLIFRIIIAVIGHSRDTGAFGNVCDRDIVVFLRLPVPEYEPFKEQLRDELKKRGYGITEWEEIQIGATIGVHTGPYPMGVGFLKKSIVNESF